MPSCGLLSREAVAPREVLLGSVPVTRLCTHPWPWPACASGLGVAGSSRSRARSSCCFAWEPRKRAQGSIGQAPQHCLPEERRIW